MSNYDSKKTSNCRQILGLLGCRYTGLHAILSLSILLLFLSPALPSAGAQPSSNGNGNANDPYQYARFSPSIAILIAVLITVLFLMAFFSIYIRHCSGNSGSSIRNLAGLGGSIRSRRNAGRGLDAAVIETFPTLDYCAVKDLHIGKGALECAICLNEFENDETLRLIPKCDHVFHPDCIDAWLASHVTCPVCRTNLVPQSGETFQVPDLNADSNPAPEIHNSQNGDVSICVPDDAQPTQQPPQVVDRNRSLNRNRPPRSKSVRLGGSGLLRKFPRSHSTGHSLVQPGENVDRFTLKLPEDVRKQVMNRTSSCVVTLPRDASSRRGNRTGGGEGSSRGRNNRRLDRSIKSDRWLFSVAPPFITRASSVRNSTAVVPDGEGTSSTTSKGLATAVDAV